jgi:hypothetical protein
MAPAAYVIPSLSGGLHCGNGSPGRRRERAAIHGPPDRVVSSGISLTADD